MNRDRLSEIIWWTWSGSNRRPLPCHGSALPTAPQAHRVSFLFSPSGVKSSNQRWEGASNKEARKFHGNGTICVNFRLPCRNRLNFQQDIQNQEDMPNTSAPEQSVSLPGTALTVRETVGRASRRRGSLKRSE